MGSLSPETRFWRRVNKTDTCWLWTGPLTAGNGTGYGTLMIAGKNVVAHRFSWLLHGNETPPQGWWHQKNTSGAQLDHLCRVRHCVNPDHLEVVSQQVNLRRQGIRQDNISGERGVSWYPSQQIWRGRVNINGKCYQKKSKDRAVVAAWVVEMRAKLFG